MMELHEVLFVSLIALATLLFISGRRGVRKKAEEEHARAMREFEALREERERAEAALKANFKAHRVNLENLILDLQISNRRMVQSSQVLPELSREQYRHSVLTVKGKGEFSDAVEMGSASDKNQSRVYN